MSNQVFWPLTYNVIRGRVENHTFGMVRDGGSTPHQGWDFEASPGTTTYAIASGKVEFVKVNSGAYGTQVCHSFPFGGKTLYAFYAHLSNVLVKVGDTITQGMAIGATGKTGNASTLAAKDDHLHFEIREKAVLGTGLGGRLSPLKVYGVCPLKQAAYQNFSHIMAPPSVVLRGGY